MTVQSASREHQDHGNFEHAGIHSQARNDQDGREGYPHGCETAPNRWDWDCQRDCQRSWGLQRHPYGRPKLCLHRRDEPRRRRRTRQGTVIPLPTVGLPKKVQSSRDCHTCAGRMASTFPDRSRTRYRPVEEQRSPPIPPSDTVLPPSLLSAVKQQAGKRGKTDSIDTCMSGGVSRRNAISPLR